MGGQSVLASRRGWLRPAWMRGDTRLALERSSRWVCRCGRPMQRPGCFAPTVVAHWLTNPPAGRSIRYNGWCINPMNDSLMHAQILLAGGRKAEARALLQAVLRADRANEDAWLLYADAAEGEAERRQALRLCLRFNPSAARARAALEQPAAEVQPAAEGQPAAERLPADLPPVVGPDIGPVSPRAVENPPFTVPPDQVAQEEYRQAAEQAEARAVQETAQQPPARPVIRPLKIQAERRRLRMTGELPPAAEPGRTGSRRWVIYGALSAAALIVLTTLLVALLFALGRLP